MLLREIEVDKLLMLHACTRPYMESFDLFMVQLSLLSKDLWGDYRALRVGLSYIGGCIEKKISE
jgi:hypothetical protein